MVRHVLNEITEIVDDIRLFTVIIDCTHANTEVKIFYEILNSIYHEHGLSRKGSSSSHFYDVFWKFIKTEKTTLIVVLDNVSDSTNLDVLYSLSRPFQFVDKPMDIMIGIICITNNIYFDET